MITAIEAIELRGEYTRKRVMEDYPEIPGIMEGLDKAIRQAASEGETHIHCTLDSERLAEHVIPRLDNQGFKCEVADYRGEHPTLRIQWAQG